MTEQQSQSQHSSSTSSSDQENLKKTVEEVFEHVQLPGTVEQHGNLFSIKLEKGTLWTSSGGIAEFNKALEDAFQKEFEE